MFATQWISLALLFLLASVFSEFNGRYGWVLIPLTTGIFWIVGWLPFTYFQTAIPIVIMLGVISYLREQLKVKFLVAGSSGGIFWKIVAFLMFIQVATIFVNGLVIYNVTIANTQSDIQNWKIESANSVYGSYTGISAIDQVVTGLTFVWMSWNMLWSMVTAIFTIYPSLITNFHVPAGIAMLLSLGFYLLFAIELFVLLYRPQRNPET